MWGSEVMKKRIAIIGGGIAGLAFAIYYKKLGGRVDIYERSDLSGREGLGFIMLENGVEGMARLGLKPDLLATGYHLKKCNLLDDSGNKLVSESLEGSFGIARKSFIDILLAQIPRDWLHFNYHFSHFDWADNGEASAAVFRDGRKVEADIYLGCDGARSAVRREIFPSASYSDVKVKELVSIVKHPLLVAACRQSFIKYSAVGGGLALGMVPADKEHLVWFLQYDAAKYALADLNVATKRQFVRFLTQHWQCPAGKLVEATDFSKSHEWHTCYLHALERFYHRNVILLGDAAHASLTFTSQGVNSAIVDAIELATLLNNTHPRFPQFAIEHFSVMRQKVVSQYLQQGLALQNEFLLPSEKDKKIPFAF